MKKIILLFLLLCSTIVFADENSPIGYWKTIDDVSGKPKAIVQIWESKNKELFGKVSKLYPRPGYDETSTCSKCEGEKHNQKIVGLVILESLKRNQEKMNEWHNGEILDPKNGKVYHCNIRLAEQGKKLHVRGFLGLPLFGRTQTWEKVDQSTIG